MAGARGVRLRPHHQDEIRHKIQASQIVNRLEDYVFSKVELQPAQVTAALGLLRKCMADLSENKQEVTVRHIESLTEEQTRLMAEEVIEQVRSSSSVRPIEPDPVHDSLQAGVSGSKAAQTDS